MKVPGDGRKLFFVRRSWGRRPFRKRGKGYDQGGVKVEEKAPVEERQETGQGRITSLDKRMWGLHVRVEER